VVVFQLGVTLGSLPLETTVNYGVRRVIKNAKTENTKF